MSKAVAVKSCESREEAEFLKSMLEKHGIRAMVDADDYAGLPLQTSGGVELSVGGRRRASVCNPRNVRKGLMWMTQVV